MDNKHIEGMAVPNIVKEMRYEVQQRLQAMLDASPMLCAIFDDDGQIIEVNQAAVGMFGLKDKDEFRTQFYDLCPKYQPDGILTLHKVHQMLQLALANGRAHFEWMHQTLDGAPIPCEVYLARVHLEHKHAVISYAWDLREQREILNKLGEMERGREAFEMAMLKNHELELKLREQDMNERVKLMFDSAPMIIEFWDRTFKPIDCNQTTLDFYGYSSKEEYKSDLNDSLIDYQVKDVSSWSEWNKNLGQAFLSGFHHFEYSDMKQNGDIVYLESECVRTSYGGEDVVVTYSTDITRMRELQREQQRIVIAEESSRAKSRFLARMSHEIRTPITAVLGISEIQLQNPKLPTEMEESFSAIHNSASLLLGIINDILDLSRIESGKMTLQQVKYEVASMISNVTNLHHIHLGDKEINFLLQVDEDLPAFLIGDPLRIEQIMNNLLSNAFKYTEAGSIEMSFECIRREGNHAILALSVKDTGLGMTQEQLNILGKDYIRFHEKEHQLIGGTGLGLSIVYNLAQIMDAQVNMKSEPGAGTTVTVLLRQKVASLEILGKERAKSLQQFESGLRSAAKRLRFVPESMPYGKVLVVDDVDANLYVTKGLLAFYDINVETCVSGNEAINKIKNGKVYDIVFMDYMMPGLNGTEAMRIMRALGYSKPIVALTANAMIGKAEEFLRDGFDGFISKPIQTNHLNTILVKYVKSKRPPSVSNVPSPQLQPADIDSFQIDEGLLKKLRTDFARDQKNMYIDIEQAIKTGDMETAHRLAHSIKGLAGLIYESVLVSAAEKVEHLLAEGQVPPYDQLAALENEMNRVLEKIGTPKVLESHDKEFDKAKAIELFDILQPLLEVKNAECLDYIDDLRAIPETTVLVKMIENFDFAMALTNMSILREAFTE